MPLSDRSPLRRPDAYGIAAVWLVAVVALDPRGEFPLNDDWSYALAVRQSIAAGAFRPTGWTSMPLVTNVAWGALFSAGGVTFQALRLSTVVAGALGGVAAYALAAEAGARRPLAGLVTATFLFCPLTLGLSVTFMTDVPYAALTLWAAVLLARHLRSGSAAALWGGAALAVAATLSRQTGLALPIAFGMALLWERGPSLATLGRAALPLAASAGALVALQLWLAAAGQTPALYSAKTDALAERLAGPAGLSAVAGNLHGVALTAGLLLAPVLVVVAVGLWRYDRRGAVRWVGGAGALVVGLGTVRVAAGGPGMLPLLGNTVVAGGIGPLTLIDALVLGADPPGLPRAVWVLATVVGTLGAAVLTGALGWGLARAVRQRGGAVGLMLVLAGGGTLAPLLPGDLFDRYLVVVLPLVAAGAPALVPLRPPPRRVWAGSALALGLLAAFAVAGTHDYLAWNRARWSLLESAPPEVESRIDGGFEFNGLTRYDPAEARRPGESWWSRGGDDVIAFGVLPGYRVVAEAPYRRWLPPGRARVVWLRRAP